MAHAQQPADIGKDSDPERDFFKPTAVFNGDEAKIKGCRDFYEALRQQDLPEDITPKLDAYWWARDPDYCFTCLHIMLIYGHEKLFKKVLLEKDANPSAEDLARLPNGERLLFFRAPDQQSLLHVAIVNNRWEAATFLLLAILGSEASVVKQAPSAKKRGLKRQPPSPEEYFKRLNLKPEDRLRFLRARDSEGSTALMLAAERGQAALVKELARFETGMADDRGFTALMRAYISPRREIDGLLNSGMSCEDARVSPSAPLSEMVEYDANVDSDDDGAGEEEEDEGEGEKGEKLLVHEFLKAYRGPYDDVLQRDTPKFGVSEGFLNPCYLESAHIAKDCSLELTPTRGGVKPSSSGKLIWKEPPPESKEASKKLVALAKWFGAAKRGNTSYISSEMTKMYKAVVPQLCSTDALMFAALHRQGGVASILAPKLYTRADANNYTALYKAAEYVSIDVANILAPFQYGRENDESDDACYAIEEALRGAAIPLFKLLAPYELWININKFKEVFEEACKVNDAQAEGVDADSSARDEDYDTLKELLEQYEKLSTPEAKAAKLHFDIVDAIRRDSWADLKQAMDRYKAAPGGGPLEEFKSFFYIVDRKKKDRDAARYSIPALALIYDKYRNGEDDGEVKKAGSTDVLEHLGKECKELCEARADELSKLSTLINSPAKSCKLLGVATLPANGV